MNRDRPLTDDEMGARFLHNAVLLGESYNPGKPLPVVDDDVLDDPVLAMLDDLDAPLTAEQEFRIRHAPPSPCCSDPAPLAEQTADQKQARLDTIKRLAPSYQPGGSRWRDDRVDPVEAHRQYLAREEERRRQRLARKAEQRRTRYAAKTAREEGRPVRPMQWLADMSCEQKRAHNAELAKQRQRRRRARLSS